MHALTQAVILGVLTGGVYALMASGQTLIFGIMKVVNLAQGALVILGAYLTYTLFTHLGMDPFLSILITTPILFCLSPDPDVQRATYSAFAPAEFAVQS